MTRTTISLVAGRVTLAGVTVITLPDGAGIVTLSADETRELYDALHASAMEAARDKHGERIAARAEANSAW